MLFGARRKGSDVVVRIAVTVLCVLLAATQCGSVQQHDATTGIINHPGEIPAHPDGPTGSDFGRDGINRITNPTPGAPPAVRHTTRYPPIDHNGSGEPYEGAGDGPIDDSSLPNKPNLTAYDGFTDPPKGPAIGEWPNNPVRYKKRSLLQVTTPSPATVMPTPLTNRTQVHDDMMLEPMGCFNATAMELVSIIHYVHVKGYQPCQSHIFEEVVDLFGTLEDSPYLIWAMAACVGVMWLAMAIKLVAPPAYWTAIDFAAFSARSGFSLFAFLFMALGLVVVTQHHPNLVWLPTAVTGILIIVCASLRVALAIRGRTLKALLPTVNAVLNSAQFDSPMVTHTPIPHHTAGVYDMEHGFFYCMGSKTKASSIPGGFTCKTITGKYQYAGSTVSADSTSPQLKVVLYSRSAKFMPSGVVSAIHALKGLTQTKKEKEPEMTLYSRLMAEAEDV